MDVAQHVKLKLAGFVMDFFLSVVFVQMVW